MLGVRYKILVVSLLFIAKVFTPNIFYKPKTVECKYPEKKEYSTLKFLNFTPSPLNFKILNEIQPWKLIKYYFIFRGKQNKPEVWNIHREFLKYDFKYYLFFLCRIQDKFFLDRVFLRNNSCNNFNALIETGFALYAERNYGISLY